MSGPILRLAIPAPLRRLFDYLPPAELSGPLLRGQRFRVPFGRSQTVGILVEVATESTLPQSRLKRALSQLDTTPLLSDTILALLKWAAAYYHHPHGDVYLSALPIWLRQGKVAQRQNPRIWSLTVAGADIDPDTLKRAPKQAALLRLLQTQRDGLEREALAAQLDNWQAPMRRLVELGWVEIQEKTGLPAATTQQHTPPPLLNEHQQHAVSAIVAARGSFQPFLLDGVTGSGKTEVYLAAIEAVLATGHQVLVLVPEIGLTPQLLSRFRRRIREPIALLHSGLSDGERLGAWLSASHGEAPLIIGTRSAVFTPLVRPGLIILDEEHDTSFTQQEGFRYSARDVAVMRARSENIPVVLGSATPSLESLANVELGRYRELRLPERAGAAVHPSVRLVDMRNQSLQEGLSQQLLNAMAHHLGQNGQVLLFLNRRGYAPTLLCHDCGWVSHCPRCDAHTTLYAGDRRLRCHHCGMERPVTAHCPDCGSEDLRPVGQGTERIEQLITAHFPDHPLVRIDRDSTRRKGSMEAMLETVHSGKSRILIGTQMLAKGHHFPDVTLVAILNADQGLFSVDFRAAERMAQQIVQVAGRAGRAERPGEVLIQTHCPDHPLLQLLVEEDYHHFARASLEERRAALLPPFGHLALLRAEATRQEAPMAFLEKALQLARTHAIPGVMLLGPVPAPMERRAGRFRAQLLLQSEQRAPLHHLLSSWAVQLEALKEGRRVRWSLDIDPVDMY